MSLAYVPAALVPLGVYVVLQVPPELSVQVVGLKLPPPLVSPNVTTPPVTKPAEPLSIAVTVTPVVEPYRAFTALTVAVVGATASPVPLSATCCRVPDAFSVLSVMLTSPVFDPTACGVNDALMLQLFPAVSVVLGVQPDPVRE
jgi:hypothetical protein